MQHAALAQRIDAIETLMADRLHLRGGLAQMQRDAQAHLPRPIRPRLAELVEARARLANPATARALEAARVADSCHRVERVLRDIPKGKYRRRARSRRVGIAALRVLIVVVAALIVVYMRGLA